MVPCISSLKHQHTEIELVIVSCWTNIVFRYVPGQLTTSGSPKLYLFIEFLWSLKICVQFLLHACQVCYKMASRTAGFDSSFRHRFPLKPFPGHFQSCLINLVRYVDAVAYFQSPSSVNLLVPMFGPRCIIHCTESTSGCGCSQHLWKELECVLSCSDLYIFTCRFFPQTNVIQAKINASCDTEKLAFSWHFMCQT